MSNFKFETENFKTRNMGNFNGVTPPIDGEYFTIKRGYKLRPSTLRRLNEIKAGHRDINIYMNTIVDEAINYYYESVFLKYEAF